MSERRLREILLYGGLICGLFLGFMAAVLFLPCESTTKAITVNRSKAETVYIVNHAETSFSNAQIRHDIPAWTLAANRDFAPEWGTPQVKIKLVKRLPDLTFRQTPNVAVVSVEQNGPIQGALAYHTMTWAGVPEIVLYAGVANAYDYSNSVDFTHELFELLGDPTTSTFNVNPWSNITQISFVGKAATQVVVGATWIQEACDPVEAVADAYKVHGVLISDFVTKNWWNDTTVGGFDFSGHLHQPFQIDRGGYAGYEINGQWNEILNFSKNRADQSGFLKGERAEYR